MKEAIYAMKKHHQTLLTFPVFERSQADGIRMTSYLPRETKRE